VHIFYFLVEKNWAVRCNARCNLIVRFDWASRRDSKKRFGKITFVSSGVFWADGMKILPQIDPKIEKKCRDVIKRMLVKLREKYYF